MILDCYFGVIKAKDQAVLLLHGKGGLLEERRRRNGKYCDTFHINT